MTSGLGRKCFGVIVIATTGEDETSVARGGNAALSCLSSVADPMYVIWVRCDACITAHGIDVVPFELWKQYYVNTTRVHGPSYHSFSLRPETFLRVLTRRAYCPPFGWGSTLDHLYHCVRLLVVFQGFKSGPVPVNQMFRGSMCLPFTGLASSNGNGTRSKPATHAVDRRSIIHGCTL